MSSDVGSSYQEGEEQEEEEDDLNLFDVNEDKLHQYLKDMRLEDLFVEVVEELLVEAPDNPVKFVLDYIYAAYPEQANESSYAKTFAKGQHCLIGGGIPMTGIVDNYDDGVESDENENKTNGSEDEDEEIVSQVRKQGSKNGLDQRRRSVYSEVLELKGAENTRKFPKTEKEYELMINTFDTNMLFSHLLPKQKREMCECFKPVEFRKDDLICREGKEAHLFYVIAEGECETIVDGKPVMFCHEGDAFGELALLHNHSYRASQKVSSDVLKGWCISRIEYKLQMMHASKTRRDELVKMLGSIDLFNNLTTVEKFQVADALELKTFEKGDTIIKQHDPSEAFYIILSGEVTCTQRFSPENPDNFVATLTKGDHFGDVALITSRPRAASVKVTSDKPVECLVLERGRFTRVLGPLTPILQRNMDTYKRFISDKI